MDNNTSILKHKNLYKCRKKGNKMDYKRNFITNVIFKIDFPIILELKESVPSKFQTSISEDFPILREQNGLDLNISVSSQEESNDGKVSLGRRVWQFNNKEKTKFVTLSHNSLILEYVNYYKNFKEFTSDINNLLEALFKEYKIEIIDRIGLRYVDQIRLDSGNPLDWNGIINENLISSIKFANSKNLIRTMQEIRIKEDSYNLVFRYGIPNSQYPSKIVRKEFAFDTDCFSEGQFSSEEIPKLLDTYHEVVKDIFEKSIGKELRKIMNLKEGK